MVKQAGVKSNVLVERHSRGERKERLGQGHPGKKRFERESTG